MKGIVFVLLAFMLVQPCALAEELMKQVDELHKANEDLQAEIDHYCNRKVCACGATNSSDAVYCKACGKEL